MINTGIVAIAIAMNGCAKMRPAYPSVLLKFQTSGSIQGLIKAAMIIMKTTRSLLHHSVLKSILLLFVRLFQILIESQ